MKRYKQNGFFEEGTTFVLTMDTDALTESYELDTLQSNWIEIKESGSNQIKGTLNATYVIDENVRQKAWNFPNTLRFIQKEFVSLKN